MIDPTLDRDAIFAAIAERLTECLDFAVEAPKVGYTVPVAGDQPCGYVLPYEEQPEQRVGFPPVHHVMPEVRFYLRYEAADLNPAVTINKVIGTVDVALRATEEERGVPGGENLFHTTLGGLALSVWREHTVVEPGQLGRQAVVSMVLHVTAPEP